MAYDYIYGDNIEAEHPEITVSIECITPDTAKRMLETNVQNRKKKRESIVAALNDGEWRLNGETIVFSDTGVLLDGQNRLAACVRADKPIYTIVVRGIKGDVQATMDAGVKRSVADQLRIMGYAHPDDLARVGTQLYRVKKLGLSGVYTTGYGSALSITTAGTVNYIVENADHINEVVPYERAITKRYKGASAGKVGGLIDELMKAGSEDDFKTFMDMLLGRKPPTQTMNLLVSRLNENSIKTTGRLPAKVIAALIIKAWNAYITGEELKNLRFRQGGAYPEDFPTIVSEVC